MSHKGRLGAILLAVSLGAALAGPAFSAEADTAVQGQAAEPVVDEATAAAIAEARENVTISGAWTRATPGNATNAAVYLRVGNIGTTPETLIGVRGQMADRVELHTAQMQAVTTMEVPAEDALVFEPNGNHIMLVDLRAPLREGDSFLLQLEFETGGTQTTSVQVLAPDAMGPPAPTAAVTGDITSGATEEEAPAAE